MAKAPPAFDLVGPANESESSLGFCEICRERKAKEKLFENGNCDHSFCLEDCLNKHVEAKIRKGLKIVTCPASNCNSAIKLGSVRHLISKDVLHLWEKALSKRLILNPCSPFIGPRLNRPTNSCSGPWIISGDDQEKVADDAERNIAAAIPFGEASSRKLKGIKYEKEDHEIVWPPMVVIANTRLKKDGNDKWIGKSPKELLNLFSSYNAIVKAQNFYKWYGHCGLSVLIFESSVEGYLEAERLHNHFAEEKRDRYAWNHRPVPILPNGTRQLYGYMAVKEDADRFNDYYSKGKPKLKYEMRSYQEMVVNQINHQLLWLKNRVTEQQRHEKDLKKSNTMLKEKLHMVTRDMDILRSKANLPEWKRLDERDDHEIVWPPMVVIANTSLGKDDRNKWIDMTYQELLDLLSSYDGIEALHSCDCQGHFGFRILIFESSVMGYLAAERLLKHFVEEGIDRSALNHQLVYERQLYVFMAEKGDVDRFNKYCSKGKPKLKYEMRSYREMVVNRNKQWSEENYQQRLAKRKVKLNHEPSMEEDQIRIIPEARNDKQERQQDSRTEEIERPAISGEKSCECCKCCRRSQETPDVGGRSIHFDNSWTEMAIPVLTTAIPIIWKIWKGIM